MKEDWQEVFDQLDEVGKLAVARAFLETPEVGKDNPISKELRRRGYGKPEGNASSRPESSAKPSATSGLRARPR